MSKICYLFGAGASANALPLVNQINDRVLLLIKLLTKKEHEFGEDRNHYSPFSNKENLLFVMDDLYWLLSLLDKEKGLTIDEIAFDLNKPPHEDYDRIRKVIAVYFALEQVFYGVDYRYKVFFRNLSKPNYDYRKELKILTWNYDSQIEMGFSSILDTNNLSTIRSKIGFRTKMIEKQNEMRADSFVYQLNGSATYYQSRGFRHHYFNHEIAENQNIKALTEICNSYRNVDKNKDTHSGISYRFDEHFKDNELEKEVLESTLDTEKLVIIGYSLPNFNEDLDRKIIQNMALLKKIYLQAPDAVRLSRKIENILGKRHNKVEIITETNTANFLLPNEI